MKNLYLAFAIIFLFSSCAGERVRDANGTTYTSFRVGTDTQSRTVQAGSYFSHVIGENNSTAYKETVSLGKGYLLADFGKTGLRTAKDAYRSAQLTKRTIAKEVTSRQATATAADVTKTKIAAEAGAAMEEGTPAAVELVLPPVPVQ